MNWVSFITGGMTVILTYALFTSGQDEELEEEIISSGSENTDFVVNGPSGRQVILSCQSCRKLKRHKEIEPNVYQCTRCKRHVDLR
jgi:hypothetical protein